MCKQSGGSPVSSFPSLCFFLWPGSCSYHLWGTVLSRTSAGTIGQAPMTTLSHSLHGDCTGIWQCLPPSPSSSQTPSLPPRWLFFWLFLLIPSFSNALASHGSVAIHLQLYSFICSTASLPSQEPGSHSWLFLFLLGYHLHIFIIPLFRFFVLKMFYGRYYYSSRYYVYHFSFIITLLPW